MFGYNKNRGVLGPGACKAKLLSVEIPGVLGVRILVRVDALSTGGAHDTYLEISGRQVAPG